MAPCCPEGQDAIGQSSWHGGWWEDSLVNVTEPGAKPRHDALSCPSLGAFINQFVSGVAGAVPSFKAAASILWVWSREHTDTQLLEGGALLKTPFGWAPGIFRLAQDSNAGTPPNFCLAHFPS